MAWEVEMVRIIRHLVDDLSETDPAFTNVRLQESILVAAQLTLADVDFTQVYLVDVDALTLSPDPTEGTKDNGFINLVSIKTACIIANALFKAAIINSINVSDGLSKLDSTSQAKFYQALADQRCKDYETAKWEFEAGSLVAGEAIIGPFSSPNVQTSNLPHPRHRF